MSLSLSRYIYIAIAVRRATLSDEPLRVEELVVAVVEVACLPDNLELVQLVLVALRHELLLAQLLD